MIIPEARQEWRDSCVDDGIIDICVRSLEGRGAYSFLFYSDELPRTNPGVLSQGYLKKYGFLDDGGWWCNGVDPLNNWEPMEWGCFKPRRPRIDLEKRKAIKYEHPPKTETRIFLLDVPDRIWQKVSDRYGIPIADEDRQHGFWHWVWKYNVPIIITEGAKKAGALLTAGFAAIALPGIYGGYRQQKDEEGNRVGKPSLIPDLQFFATLGREVYFCFDRDSKQKTIRNVYKAIERTGCLFIYSGCQVRVISWQQQEKGVDDFIAACGAAAFEQVYQSAQILEVWRARSFTQLTYPAAQTVERRYLGQLSIPSHAKLVAIKSPKDTGKTRTLEGIVADAIASGQWVLVLTHRVQLGQALCQRFGVPYITETRTFEFGTVLGFGLCIDSLHPKSQARFTAENWHGGVVVIDEAEQVFWHGLNSSTCQSDRVPILRQLKTLLTNVLQGDGRVFLADADLSDLSIDFVKNLAGISIDPWVVANEWRPGDGERWDIYHYPDADPSGLVSALEEHIAAGGKPLVVCSAQKAKSKWSTRTLETYFKQRFPDKRILRIDSESITDPSHPAYGAIASLDQIVGDYEIVLASPSIETGVSIDIKGHFTSCWGIFLGVQSESSARQALARLRERVPRHVWAAARGIGQVGNGAISVKALLQSQHKLTRHNIRLLQDFNLDDLDLDFQPESLRTWAQMAVRVNLGMVRYREAVLDGLRAEGHRIVAVEVGKNDELTEAIAATKAANHAAEASAIAAAADITQLEFDKLQDQKAKTQAERDRERKYALHQRYAVPVTPELVVQDDRGWYPQLRLHYYATVGRLFLRQRDSHKARSHFERGNGAAFLPDFNRTQLSTTIALLDYLGVLALTDGREVAGSDEILQQLAFKAHANRPTIETVLGARVSVADAPVAIAQKLLGKCGLKLTYMGRKGSRNHRQRIYRCLTPEDGREEVFRAWLEREAAAPSTASTPELFLVSTPSNKKDITTLPLDAKPKLDPTISSEYQERREAIASTPTVSTTRTGTNARERSRGVGLLMPGSIVECLGRAGQWAVKYCTGVFAKIVDRYGEEEIVSCEYLRLAGTVA